MTTLRPVYHNDRPLGYASTLHDAARQADSIGLGCHLHASEPNRWADIYETDAAFIVVSRAVAGPRASQAGRDDEAKRWGWE